MFWNGHLDMLKCNGKTTGNHENSDRVMTNQPGDFDMRILGGVLICVWVTDMLSHGNIPYIMELGGECANVMSWGILV